MVLKTKEIELSDGTKLTMKELSFAAQLRLQQAETTPEKVYKEMLGEDYKHLENAGQQDYIKIFDAFKELTGQQDDIPLSKETKNGK